jgi:aryl-phospho-beta-D-glucosidase BglC (GH1 family)
MTRILAALLLLALSIAPAHARGGVEASNKTYLMGVNLAGLGDGSAIPGAANVDFGLPTATEFDFIRSKNLQIVRLPFLWERVQPTLNGPLDPTYLGYIQNMVAMAQARGLKVVLDLHNYGSYSGQQLGGGTLTNAQYANVWTQLATAFAGNTGVYGYDIMNEPCCGITAATWQAAAQAAIYRIRSVDHTTPIIVEGVGYSSAYAWIANGNDILKYLLDPYNNLIFSAHFYMDRDSSGTNFIWANEVATGDQLDCAGGAGHCATLGTNIGVKRLTQGSGGTQGWVPWITTNHLRGYIGECGAGNDNPAWNAALSNAVAVMQANNVSYTYWNMGPFYGSYPYSIEPNGVLDKLQVAALTQFSNAYQPTYYGLTGPPRGTGGVASTSFTVNYSGIIYASTVLTPHATGASGTFSPTSVTLSPGLNASASFTATLPSASIAALSTTNSRALTDPAAVGYATASDQFLSAGNLTPPNIYSLRKIYAPYIGPAVRLRRASDNATADFGYTGLAVNSGLNASAISTWAAGSSLFLDTWYDQGPSGNNMGLTGPISSGDRASTIADEPQFYTSCPVTLGATSGLPCIYFNGSSYLAANSPVNGNTAQTVLAVFAPANHMQGSLLNWQFCCGQTAINAWNSDEFSASNIGSLRSYAQDGTWGVFGASYDTTTASNGLDAFTNNMMVGQSLTTGSAINYPFRAYAQIGWTLFSASTFPGYVGELVIHNGFVIPSSVQSFQSDERSYWGIPGWPSFTYPSPTLNQSTSAANTYPWRGANEGGIGFGQNFDAIPSASEELYYASRGANIVRFPTAWEQIQPNLCTGNTSLNASEMSLLDTVIANNTAAGKDTLIDIHNFGSYNYNYHSTCASPPDSGLISNTTTGGYFVNLWTQLATRYAGNAKVKFDLMNEPAPITAAQSETIFQNTINAIRGAGASQYIFVEMGSSYAACSDVSGNSGAYFKALTDSGHAVGAAGNKLVLECHSYLESCGYDCNDYAGQGDALSNIQTATTYAQANGIPLFLGETSVGFTQSMYAEDKVLFDYMAAHAYAGTGTGGWIGFTPWGAGPGWPDNYVLKYQPSGQAGLWIDRPTMRLISTYWTGGTWTAAGGTWPNTVQFP